MQLIQRHHYLLSFFFSSRRRHTRLQGDWSSDVCSSDLISVVGRSRQLDSVSRPAPPSSGAQVELPSRELVNAMRRSEERRVGKECRARGGTDREKKKRVMRREGGSAECQHRRAGRG